MSSKHDDWRSAFPTHIESHDVRIVNDSPTRDPSGTSVLEAATGEKFLDVYRAVVVMDGDVYEVTRQAALPRDYEGPALLERASR